jgi:uncharacterized coiled-coil protein SlyX
MDTQPSSEWDGIDRRMLAEAVAQHQRGVRFDATVNLGHILTFIGFVITGASMYMTLDKRVVVLEEGVKAQARLDASQDSRVNESVARLEAQLAKMDGKLDRLIEKRRD